MVTANYKYLKPNPFITYRDPKTGKWIVVLSNPQQNKTQSAET